MPRLTVGQLQELIQDLPPEMEVRAAVQPTWPFEHAIDDAFVLLSKVEEEEEEDCTEVNTADGEGFKPEAVLYLALGDQLRYLPSVIAREIGW